MDRMWINSILGEADKCYIPNILLLRVPCWHVATGSLELCTHNHKFTHQIETHAHTNKANRVDTNTRRCTLIWTCGIDTLLPNIHASVCQRGLQLEGHYWWQQVGGKEIRGAESQCGMSHGQTEEIYDWSSSTLAAWCCDFRMPGMGVRSDSGFSLYTLSGNCKPSVTDWRRKFGLRYMVFACLVF